jgi:L-alanine-DL-glutamate epimerase-like enolase superfamily enzyme
MSSEDRFRVIRVERYERAVRFRAPFRFGAATVTSAPQAFARAWIEFADGSSAAGASAEMMMPKWFDKSPGRSDADDLADLRRSLVAAAEAYTSDAHRRSAFGHHAVHGPALQHVAEQRGSNALTAGFGVSLVDRAVLDALCQHAGVSFWTAMRANLSQIDAARLAPDLKDFDVAGFLRSFAPRAEIALRHTIGLVDPLTPDDVVAPLGDGLPQTLEEVIAVHRPRYFKLKLSGDTHADVRRIESVAAILDRIDAPYHVTLDGNEQYDAVDEVLACWRSIAARSGLRRFAASTLWIEQPLPRELATSASVAALAAFKPVVIDESDSTVDAFPAARALGYAGVSSKSCKGLYKSVLNAARCARWNAEVGEPRFFLSAEDLTAQAGLSLQQDLALVGLLGIEHGERNGHHYVDGVKGQSASDAEGRRFLAAHPDLYEPCHGTVRVSIRDGKLRFSSLDAPGYASAGEPDWSALERIATTVVTEPS